MQKKSLAINSEDKDVQYNLAYLYTQTKKYKLAAQAYENALKGDNSDKDIYYNLAVIFAKYIKDDKKANQYYQKYTQYK